jgi:hypothetical protein
MLAQARKLNDMVSVGVEPIEAAKRAAELTDPRNATLREARTKEFGDMTPITADEVTDAFESFLGKVNPFGGEPDLPRHLSPVLLADINGMFQRQYLLTGDEAAARKYAKKDIARVWGVTEVGGQARLMKYAPEAVYGGPDASGWISEQFNEDMSYWDLEEGSKVHLVADGQTAREVGAGARVTWAVYVEKADATINPLSVGDRGKAQRWYGDINLRNRARVSGVVADETARDEALANAGRKKMTSEELEALKAERELDRQEAVAAAQQSTRQDLEWVGDKAGEAWDYLNNLGPRSNGGGQMGRGR